MFTPTLLKINLPKTFWLSCWFYEEPQKFFVVEKGSSDYKKTKKEMILIKALDFNFGHNCSSMAVRNPSSKSSFY